MKLSMGKRIVLFIHWLVSLLVVAAIVFSRYAGQYEVMLKNIIGANVFRIGLFAFLGVYVILCLVTLIMLCRKSTSRSDRGFITVDSSETGKVRISVGAVEQMTKQAVGAVNGIADMRIGIANDDDAIAINVNVSMVNGSHVPTVTMNMQRAIRQFVEMNCGVAVRSVTINVQSVVNPDEAAKKGKRVEMGAPAMSVTVPTVASQETQVYEPTYEAYAQPVEYPAATEVQENPAAQETFYQGEELPVEETFTEIPAEEAEAITAQPVEEESAVAEMPVAEEVVFAAVDAETDEENKETV